MVRATAVRQPTVKPKLKFRLRVMLGDGIPIGPGKIDLLEAVREHGSISAGARAIGMSYRRAWLLLNEMNGSMKAPVIETTQGGEKGGGAVLTAMGETVIDLYRDIEQRAAAATAPQASALLRLVAKAG